MFDADVFDAAFFEVDDSPEPEPPPQPSGGPWISHGTIHLGKEPKH